MTPPAAAVLMWMAMMLAMMAPCAALLARAYGRMRQPRGARALGMAAIAAAYLGVWMAFAVAAGLGHAALAAGGALEDARLSSVLACGVLIAVAGAYQLTPLKDSCAAHCRSPLGFVAAHWRDGIAGAARMGVLHGLYCVGCCALLVAALFALGVMSLAWMALLATLIFAERALQAGPWLTRASGASAILYGGMLIAGQ
jgi:predicted metal-binding membrane protein